MQKWSIIEKNLQSFPLLQLKVGSENGGDIENVNRVHEIDKTVAYRAINSTITTTLSFIHIHNSFADGASS